MSVNSISQKLDENYLFGCIKYKTRYNIYLMPIALWILNYQKYDPDYKPEIWSYIFRDNILNVTDDKIELFFISITKYKLNIVDLDTYMGINKNSHSTLRFFIDFDKKIFVNGFFDVSIEEYLPDNSWEGLFGYPSEYIPYSFRLYFD